MTKSKKKESREERLHSAICFAVFRMNQSLVAAGDPDLREVKDVLRKALIEYADAMEKK